MWWDLSVKSFKFCANNQNFAVFTLKLHISYLANALASPTLQNYLENLAVTKERIYFYIAWCKMNYLTQFHGGDLILPVIIKKCKCFPKTINILSSDLAVQAAAFVGCVIWCGCHYGFVLYLKCLQISWLTHLSSLFHIACIKHLLMHHNIYPSVLVLYTYLTIPYSCIPT